MSIRPACRAAVALLALLAPAACAAPEPPTAPLSATAEPRSGPGRTPEEPFTLVSVDAGGSITCGLDTVGRAWCWGFRTGNGTFGRSRVPVLVATSQTFDALAVGTAHACGLAKVGRRVAYCWGSNDEGEFGIGVLSAAAAPVLAAGGVEWTSLAASYNHTCGVSPAGDGFCWGQNQSAWGTGWLGDGTRTNRLDPTPIASSLKWSQIVAGREFSCGLSTSGYAYCWGGHLFGQLGAGPQVPGSTVPVAVDTHMTFVSITAGDRHACALRANGDAYCWGRNFGGQIGIGTAGVDNANPRSPVLVHGGLQFQQIEASTAIGQSTCGITTGGDAYCWGYNLDGEAGVGVQGFITVPTKVLAPFTFSQVSVGAFHACGIRADNSGVYCWGNSTGLGNGSTEDSYVPVPVAYPAFP